MDAFSFAMADIDREQRFATKQANVLMVWKDV